MVLSTAYPQILWSVKDYGCDAFLAKPYDANKLLLTVEKLLLKGKEKRRFSLMRDGLKNRLVYLDRFLGRG